MHDKPSPHQEKHKAFELALRLLSLRQHARYEIREKLRLKGFSNVAAEHTIQRLDQLQLLDDLAFSTGFIRSRCRTKPSGPYKLRYELRKKGIEEEVIDQALDGFDSWEECKKAAIKKLPHLKGERQVRERKLQAHLMSRGFDNEVIREVLSELQTGA
ncbi:regulatory protein RecX [Prosthecochloris sp. CIB 2401]|uniref:regulatory protein RecX n=1 Tax=Prosthecochloris sp. CIB 2401 TaxID=1868325 RepID=UPI00080AC234|nr:regulatory protein RecX [Prosthecochloris sp. CIB 2401]ANT65635.1 Regulatory protein RecX [Prosthecochloris sp. CIB 2401]